MRIDGATGVYGIIGWPVRHSRSPAMHNAAFAALGLNKVYVPLPAREAGAAVAAVRSLGICGASVTIPHKEGVVEYLDEVEPVAAKIGAVNTLVVEAEGRIVGHNTDWIGANRALAEAGVELATATVLLLGAGGSARAIGFGLLAAGARVVLANRSEDKGQRLAAELGCDFVPLAEVDRCEADVLLNATAVGMAPLERLSPVPESVLGRFQTVFDIVYAPRQTRLLAAAAARGCRCVEGLAMLLYQGVAQFELWTGRPAPVEVMREAICS